jgi:FAD/FMN-containing dehydrogenase
MQRENQTTNTHDQLSIPQLRSAIQGQVIAPNDDGYDKARIVFYGSYNNRRPAVIVRPANADDVAHVVSLARESGIELAVRSGGHSVAGHSSTEGGIVLDLSSLKGLDIDVEGRTAWAESGLTAGEYTRAAAQHGLATGFGDTASVGIGGLTVGGGIGFLIRKYGLTIDNLLAVDIVTADGQLRRADADTNTDLFWAIRGGGGNFGVVTRFQFRLHEVDTIVGGMLILPATPDIIMRFVAAADAAPEELSTIANIMSAPPMPFLPQEHHGKLVIMALMAYVGDVSSADQVYAPFRALGPLVDMVKSMPYPGIYTLFGPEEEFHPPQEVSHTLFLNKINLGMAETIVEHLQRAQTFAVTQIRVLGGAMARVPADATAFAHRDRPIMVALGAIYEDAAETPKHKAWIQDYIAALHDGTSGVYVNFLGNEGGERVHEAYPGATWDRLAAIKTRYDPTNVFRLNQNIPPASNGA